MRRAGVLSCLAAPVLVLSPPGRAAEDWSFELSPYAWLAGLDGEIGTVPGAPPAPVDISPSDVVEDVDAAIMLLFSARRGRHGVFADLFYADISSDEELLPPPIDLSLKVRAENAIVSLAYQYRFLSAGDVSADLLVGARYWDMDSRLSFGGGSGFLAGRQLKSSESWTDPLVGMKGSMPLGASRFYLEGGAAVGGFGVGSDLFYEVSGAIGYRWSETIGTAVGYRLYDVDYDSGGFSYDVRQDGWQLGLSWRF
jgi:hypothetical protein